jgi:hypothetical protein
MKGCAKAIQINDKKLLQQPEHLKGEKKKVAAGRLLVM